MCCQWAETLAVPWRFWSRIRPTQMAQIQSTQEPLGFTTRLRAGTFVVAAVRLLGLGAIERFHAANSASRSALK